MGQDPNNDANNFTKRVRTNNHNQNKTKDQTTETVPVSNTKVQHPLLVNMKVIFIVILHQYLSTAYFNFVLIRSLNNSGSSTSMSGP